MLVAAAGVMSMIQQVYANKGGIPNLGRDRNLNAFNSCADHLDQRKCTFVPEEQTPPGPTPPTLDD
jgi:hypothetical protein